MRLRFVVSQIAAEGRSRNQASRRSTSSSRSSALWAPPGTPTIEAKRGSSLQSGRSIRSMNSCQWRSSIV